MRRAGNDLYNNQTAIKFYENNLYKCYGNIQSTKIVVVCRNLANVRFWGYSRLATSSQSNRVLKRQPMRNRVESAGKKTSVDHFKRLK